VIAQMQPAAQALAEQDQQEIGEQRQGDLHRMSEGAASAGERSM